jgi:hypothetical protein
MVKSSMQVVAFLCKKKTIKFKTHKNNTLFFFQMKL